MTGLEVLAVGSAALCFRFTWLCWRDNKAGEETAFVWLALACLFGVVLVIGLLAMLVESI